MHLMMDESFTKNSVSLNHNSNNILCNNTSDEIGFLFFKESNMEQKDGYKLARKNPENISIFASSNKSQA